jgi:hypothetical protein
MTLSLFRGVVRRRRRCPNFARSMWNVGIGVILLVTGGLGCSNDSDKPERNPYGLGQYEECIQAGASFDARIGSDPCCEGLKRTQDVVEYDAGTGYLQRCDYAGPPSIHACLACGDGRCGPRENRCNCEEDCGDLP